MRIKAGDRVRKRDNKNPDQIGVVREIHGTEATVDWAFGAPTAGNVARLILAGK